MTIAQELESQEDISKDVIFPLGAYNTVNVGVARRRHRLFLQSVNLI